MPAPAGRAASFVPADIDRVRQALAMLNDGPAAGAPAPAVPAAAVPAPEVTAAEETGTAGEEEPDTAPMPATRPSGTTIPRPAPIEAPRGPFEPARPRERHAEQEDAGAAGPGTDIPQAPDPAGLPAPAGTAGAGEPAAAAEAAEAAERDLPAGAVEKLGQIRDLALMAEAIGEDNLERNFERVSERQRELIREFFEQARPGQNGGD